MRKQKTKNMEELVILRTYKDQYTTGDIYIDNKLFCNTLELLDLKNQKNVSCIPEGTYTAQVQKHAKKGFIIRIDGVRNRTGILVHTGNDICDTQGCILVGTLVINQPKLIFSGSCMRQLTSKLGLKIFKISIYEDISSKLNQKNSD